MERWIFSTLWVDLRWCFYAFILGVAKRIPGSKQMECDLLHLIKTSNCIISSVY